jgi:hypothetical protein
LVQHRKSDEKPVENIDGHMDLMEPQPLVGLASPTLAASHEIIEDLNRVEISSKSQPPECALKDIANSPKRDLSKRGDPFAAVYRMALPDQKAVPHDEETQSLDFL